MVFHDVSMNFVKILSLHESFLWPHKLNYVIRWGRHDKIILGLNLITFINTFILLATESEKYQPKCFKIVKISELVKVLRNLAGVIRKIPNPIFLKLISELVNLK